jgi:hypothetical protein
LGVRQNGQPKVHAQLIAQHPATSIMKGNPELAGTRCLLYLYERNEDVPLIGAR